jgi:hypothetical protein
MAQISGDQLPGHLEPGRIPVPEAEPDPGEAMKMGSRT